MLTAGTKLIFIAGSPPTIFLPIKTVNPLKLGQIRISGRLLLHWNLPSAIKQQENKTRFFKSSIRKTFLSLYQNLRLSSLIKSNFHILQILPSLLNAESWNTENFHLNSNPGIYLDLSSGDQSNLGYDGNICKPSDFCSMQINKIDSIQKVWRTEKPMQHFDVIRLIKNTLPPPHPSCIKNFPSEYHSSKDDFSWISIQMILAHCCAIFLLSGWWNIYFI